MQGQPVTNWKCGACGALHASQAEADACCVCECGRPIVDTHAKRWSRTKCERCAAKERIRSHQMRIRKLTEELESTRKSLESAQAEKRAIDLAEKRRPELWIEGEVLAQNSEPPHPGGCIERE